MEPVNKAVRHMTRAALALLWIGKNILIGLNAYIFGRAFYVFNDRILLTTLIGGYGVQRGNRINVRPTEPKCAYDLANLPEDIKLVDIELLVEPDVADMIVHDTAGR